MAKYSSLGIGAILDKETLGWTKRCSLIPLTVEMVANRVRLDNGEEMSGREENFLSPSYKLRKFSQFV